MRTNSSSFICSMLHASLFGGQTIVKKWVFNFRPCHCVYTPYTDAHGKRGNATNSSRFANSFTLLYKIYSLEMDKNASLSFIFTLIKLTAFAGANISYTK